MIIIDLLNLSYFVPKLNGAELSKIFFDRFAPFSFSVQTNKYSQIIYFEKVIILYKLTFGFSDIFASINLRSPL